ncbi:MAG: hypothetical protein KF709_10980 [Gemmatimonadaceae bacterium]|nr:hypothetical protein [Gemmatimonadaceae bacterium]
MTTSQRLQRAKRQLVLVAAGRAALYAALAAALAALLLVALDAVIGLGLTARTRLAPAPCLAALAVGLWQLAGPLRDVLRATDEQIALWFERRLPALRYTLVTQAGLAAPSPTLQSTTDAVPLERELRDAAKASLTKPAFALLLVAALLLLLPAGVMQRISAPAAGDALNRVGAGSAAAANPLATIVVRLLPPAYSGLQSEVVDNPATVQALVGSRVTVEGRGSGVTARAAGAGTGADATSGGNSSDAGGSAAEIRALASGDRWTITLPMPAAATALRLQGPAGERVLLLDPLIDSVPSVRLEAPARDSVLREPRGELPLAAELRDDLGLQDAAFELIISAGSGELYTFRTVRAAAQRFQPRTREGRIAGTLRLDTLGLKPGDMIHLRALARDFNDVTGPGQGSSETRTLRIARADEYDSVSVEPLPPAEPEKDALSQRMILMQTQELVELSRRLREAETTRRSRVIAVDQTKLRKKVGEVVFLRLGGDEDGGEHSHYAGDGHDHSPDSEVNVDDILAAAERAANADVTRSLDNHGDETPIVAINRPLLEAYNHMWRASSELETGRPAAAIPWMERAIEALQRARAAERIYLRGRPPRVVVDLARVRLAGKDEARPGQRSPRAALDPERAARLARFDNALANASLDPAATADSLLLIRVGLPEQERSAAIALDAAADALRRGGDVTTPLAAARRALLSAPPRRGTLTPWGE